jgi:hypothetical protein
VKLHILTAVTRPWNLPTIAKSIAIAAEPDCKWEIVWHLHFDLAQTDVGGHAQKNAMLDSIDDGWCWILDDDTLMHPDLLKRLDKVLTEQPDTWALVVSQTREDGRYLPAEEQQVRVGFIDAGQAIMRRDFIGDHRLPKNYVGDGEWLSDLLPSREGVVYLNETLSMHNALVP